MICASTSIGYEVITGAVIFKVYIDPTITHYDDGRDDDDDDEDDDDDDEDDDVSYRQQAKLLI